MTSAAAKKLGYHDGAEGSEKPANFGGLKWVNLSVSMKSRKEDKIILMSSQGFVPNGSLCGVIGPSGAGKSTLLSALAGTTPKTSGVRLSGNVWVEEWDSGESAKKTSYLSTGDGEVALLQQDDAFFSMLTPRETIELAAFLQLPSKRNERHGIVNRILESLGLKAHEHRRIGDRVVGGENRGGLSGGERRRLSVGVELVTAPKVFLADEATTGLDSTQAEKVVELMRKLSKERHIPCVASLHQPRASIWKKLDMVILMAPGGKVCYMGERSAATEYFEAVGYKCPTETNPAEFLIDLVSVDTEDPDQAAVDLDRIDSLANCFLEKCVPGGRMDKGAWMPPSTKSALWMSENILKKKKGRVNFHKRFFVLLRRAWRQNIRDSKLNLFRLLASVGQAFLFSQIFSSVTPGPPTAVSIADRTALLSFGVVNMSMLAVMKTLTLFGKEKSVVTRERMRKQYSGFEYLLSKVLAEFPLDALFSTAFAVMLKCRTGLRCPLAVLCSTYSLMTVAGASLGFAIGSLTSNPDAAMTAGMPVMVILMIVGIINPSGAKVEKTQPMYLQWLKLASPIKWAIEALCIAEYRDMEFLARKGFFRRVLDGPRMGAFALVQNGNQVLYALGLSTSTYEGVMKNLGRLVCANLLVSLFGLTFCGPSFIQAKEELMEDSDLEVEHMPLNAIQDEVDQIRQSNKHVSTPAPKVATMRGRV